jgi:hypothetical protein
LQLHYRGEARGITLSPEVSFDEFMDRVSAKFGYVRLALKFKDDSKVSLYDDSDYDLAIETARAGSYGRSDGRLEVWCEEI